ncbi:MAG: TatD family hydrolase [Bacteroidales bacterium]|nr:TatD family hydrolase [Bacteroidales bacterium]
MLTDTHTHLYLKEFNDDREQIIQKAIDGNVKNMLLPNIDSSSVEDLLDLCRNHPDNCFPMIGLHPGSVKHNYKEELKNTEDWLYKHKFYAIGEIGIDLYWDKTFAKEQEYVFRYQVEMAKANNLPIVIHSRNSFDEIYKILNEIKSPELKGVFHCFTGNIEQSNKIINIGFKLGIGGVITFKNSGLDKVIQQTDLKHILLETDSPYLTPVPYRGKRNESSYIYYIAEKIAAIQNTTIENVANITTNNAIRLFKFKLEGH